MNENNKEIDLLKIVEALIKYRLFIFLTVFLCSIGAVIISLTLPKIYTSTVTIMPLQQAQGDISSLSQITSGLPISGLLSSAMPGLQDPNSIYLAVLGSRKIRTELIDSFNLINVYKFDSAKVFFIEDVIKVVDNNIDVSTTDQGTIAISVRDKSPLRASKMAHFLVTQMDLILKDLSKEKAKNQRQFLEDRLRVISTDLQFAEDTLLNFRTKNKVVEISDQTKAAIDVSAKAEATYLSKELEFNIAKKMYSPDNIKVREMQTILNELRGQINDLSTKRNSDILIPPSQSLNLGLTLVRLTRQLKIQEFLFEMVTEQFEKTKFDEAKTIPQVQILDPAFIPQKRTSPKRAFIVIVTFIFSLVGSILASFLFEALRAETIHNKTRISEIKNLLIKKK